MPPSVGGPGVDGLVRLVREAQSKPVVRSTVEERIREFGAVNASPPEKWFEELAYCLLTAYSSARMGAVCVSALVEGDALVHGDVEGVRGCLRAQGHRFANKRAEYIVEARELAPTLKATLTGMRTSQQRRRWLVENIKGLGMKEASHFLRNVGYLDLAIVDRHIISNMLELGIITERPKSVTPRRYLEYEALLGAAARVLGMPLGEMDLYLWYRKTGVVAK